MSSDEIEFPEEIAARKGYLTKLSRGRQKKWQVRWFVLKDNCLFYYLDNTEEKLQGTMPLRGVRILDYELLPLPDWHRSPNCSSCRTSFGLLTRRHHCRHCGQSFCSKCSADTIEIPKYGFLAPVRVCGSCFDIVREQLRVMKIASLTAGLKSKSRVGINGTGVPSSSPTAVAAIGTMTPVPTSPQPHDVKSLEHPLHIVSPHGSPPQSSPTTTSSTSSSTPSQQPPSAPTPVSARPGNMRGSTAASSTPAAPAPNTTSPSIPENRRISGGREASASMRAGEVRPTVANVFNNNNGPVGSPNGTSHVPTSTAAIAAGHHDHGDDSDSVEEINLHDEKNNNNRAPSPAAPLPTSSPNAAVTSSPSKPATAAKKDPSSSTLAVPGTPQSGPSSSPTLVGKKEPQHQTVSERFFATFRRNKNPADHKAVTADMFAPPPSSPAVAGANGAQSPPPLALGGNGGLEKSRSGTAMSPTTPQTPQTPPYNGTISTMGTTPSKVPAPKKGVAAVRKKHMLFALPLEKQDHLFALKSADRELWIAAPNARHRKEWVTALLSMQRIDREQSEHVDRPDGDVTTWSVEQVCQWLRSLRLDMYTKVFRDQNVTGQKLVDTKNDELLNGLKISDKLHRRKILANIRYYGPDTQGLTPRAKASATVVSSPKSNNNNDAATAATPAVVVDTPSNGHGNEPVATPAVVVIPATEPVIAAVVATTPAEAVAVVVPPSSSLTSPSTVPEPTNVAPVNASPSLAPAPAPTKSTARVSFNLPDPAPSPSNGNGDNVNNGNGNGSHSRQASRSSDADQRPQPRVRVSIAHSPNASPRLGLPAVPETPLHAQSIVIPPTPAGSAGGIVGPGAANGPSDQKVGSNYRVLSKEEVGALQTPKNATFAFRIGEVVACLVSHKWLEEMRMKSAAAVVNARPDSDYIESEFEAPTPKKESRKKALADEKAAIAADKAAGVPPDVSPIDVNAPMSPSSMISPPTSPNGTPITGDDGATLTYADAMKLKKERIAAKKKKMGASSLASPRGLMGSPRTAGVQPRGFPPGPSKQSSDSDDTPNATPTQDELRRMAAPAKVVVSPATAPVPSSPVNVGDDASTLKPDELEAIRAGKLAAREASGSVSEPTLRPEDLQRLRAAGALPAAAVAPSSSLAVPGESKDEKIDSHEDKKKRMQAAAGRRKSLRAALPLEEQMTRVTGVIIRKIHEGDSFKDKFEVQVTRDGHSLIFEANQLLKFQHYEVQWTKGKLIARGGYGKVYNGLNTKDGRIIAIKEMELNVLKKKSVQKTNEVRHQIGEVTSEIELMQTLSHENIVKFLGSELDIKAKKLYIFMEKVSGGSIKDMLDMYGSLPEAVIVKYIRQTLAGLVYLHKNHVVHRDLKCGNLLITTEGIVKLSDFGVSKKFRDVVKGASKLNQTNLQTMIGSPYWMAPEVIMQSGYGRKADIWGLGCTIIEMATGKPPWDGLSPMAACFQIGEGETLPTIPQHLSAEARAFLSICLTRDQNERPSAEALVNHSWLALQDHDRVPHSDNTT